MKRKILLSLIFALSFGSISQAMDQKREDFTVKHAELFDKKPRLKDPERSGLCTYAAEKGDFTLLREAHEHGWKWDKGTFSAAARGGHLDCVSYLHENECPWGEDICDRAVDGQNGSLSSLKYLHENGYPWGTKTCATAAEIGNLEALTYLHENDCPWDVLAYECAEEYGETACLQYLMDNGCPRPPDSSSQSNDDYEPYPYELSSGEDPAYLCD